MHVEELFNKFPAPASSLCEDTETETDRDGHSQPLGSTVRMSTTYETTAYHQAKPASLELELGSLGYPAAGEAAAVLLIHGNAPGTKGVGKAASVRKHYLLSLNHFRKEELGI